MESFADPASTFDSIPNEAEPLPEVDTVLPFAGMEEALVAPAAFPDLLSSFASSCFNGLARDPAGTDRFAWALNCQQKKTYFKKTDLFNDWSYCNETQILLFHQIKLKCSKQEKDDKADLYQPRQQ